MPLNLDRITAALNAYPWAAGMLTVRDSATAARYCAVGLLLRYAGVPQEQIACAQERPDGLRHHLALLEAEYGIADWETAAMIMRANDSAASHEQAIERVQRILACEPEERMRVMDEIIETERRARRAAARAARAARDDQDGSGMLAAVG